MDIEELEVKLEVGEGQEIEYKKSANHLVKEIVAFANSRGGDIFIGVNDEGERVQLGNEQKARKRIRGALENIDPRIDAKVESFEDGGVLVLHVPNSDDFHTGNGVPYIREGEESRKMTTHEMEEHAQERGTSRWDEKLHPNFEYPEDFNQSLFDRFKRESRIFLSKKTNRF